MWAQARTTLLRSVGHYIAQANRHRTPDRRCGPPPGTSHCRWSPGIWCLGPWFVGPFPIQRVISPSTVRLQLPRSMWIHPTFHVSRVKPTHVSPLAPARPPSPPPRFVERDPVYGLTSDLLPSTWKGTSVPGRLGGVRSRGEVLGPARHVMHPQLMREFHQRQPVKPSVNSARRFSHPVSGGGPAHGAQRGAGAFARGGAIRLWGHRALGGHKDFNPGFFPSNSHPISRTCISFTNLHCI